MAEITAITNDVADPILVEVVKGNKDKVVAWINGEPGAWGFLSGQAVSTVRSYAGRDLADGERRLVWRRMWWWLEEAKAEMNERL